MRLNFVITRTKRSLLFYSALVFLLQSMAPAFQGAMAKPVAGYTDTLCTMYGPVTVFVKLEDDLPRDKLDCYECPVCVIQGNFDGQSVAHVFHIEARYLPDTDSPVGPLYQVSNPPLYSPFLSRAPPA